MEDNVIRTLRADEIECRIGTINEKGLSLLLYKDARADMKILDEVFGPLNWKRKHEVIGGNLYCTVSIYDSKKKEWIDKMDVGTESNTEKEKGQASDSFKRACVSVGIGRELYTAPFIWIGAGKVKIEKKTDNRGDRWFTNDKFKVQSIEYNENREIIGLVIMSQNGKVVYALSEGNSAAPVQDTAAQNTNAPAKTEDEKVVAINKELERTGIALDVVLQRYGVKSIQEMNESAYNNAINSLKKTKTKSKAA